MDPRKTQIYFFLALLLGASVLAFVMVLPYLQAIIVAGAFAVVFHPLYRWITWMVGGRRSIASFVTMLVVLVIVLTPLSFFGAQLFEEARSAYVSLRTEGTEELPLRGMIEKLMETLPPSFRVDIDTQLERFFEWLAGNVSTLFAGTFGALMNIFIGVMVFYYLLKEGGTMKKWIVKMSPLQDEYDKSILARMEATVGSVMRGSVVIAVVQGTLAGVGLAVFGVPNPTLWGSVAAVAALIPGIGTALVTVPGAAYLFVLDKTIPAIGLLVWGIAVVGMVDNFLVPRLIKRGMRVHPLLILLSVLGGIGFFGPLGFLIGPLVFSLLFALLDVYVSFSKEGVPKV